MVTSSPARISAARRFARPGGVEDRYHSLFVIGRGGMGSVEVALERGANGFERVVALKTLLPEGARDSRHKEMFLREARLAALLGHSNVVHAFSFGELYGELFLAMEYVEGEPLSRVLSAARDESSPDRLSPGLDPALVAFVLADACDGLHAAHELRDTGGHPLNVVHRDVSPQNVMISYEGQVKILDFGVAKFETGGHETRTGEVKGKMAYMSPEQALGEKLDRRSDLFSVGAVLFECLTGRRMWGSGTDMEVMRKLALEEPPRLDYAMPGAPTRLVDLLARLVARDPRARPETAHEVAIELRAFALQGHAPTRRTVRALMQRLFAAEEERRRIQLNQALEEVAPTRVDDLRRRIEPNASVDETSSTEAVIVRGRSSGARGEEGSRRAKRSPVAAASALVAVFVVGAAVAAAAMHSAPGASAGLPVAMPTPTAAAPGPQLSPSGITAAALPQPLAGTTSSTAISPRATTPPRSTPPAAIAPVKGTRVRPKGETKPNGSKLPDVDPTPF